MPEEYKIRLGDGSEIGPLNLQAVRDWHRQGLLQPKSPVLRPGAKKWTTLDQVLEPQAFKKPAAKARTPPPPPPPTRRDAEPARVSRPSGGGSRVGLLAVGALVVAGAAGGAWFYLGRQAAAPAARPAAPATPDPMDALVAKAVETATTEVPVLTPASARLLMARSQARILEPDQLFRRSLDALTRAQPTWSAAEANDVGQITNTLYANLSGRDRARLASYIDRVRGHRSTTPQEDREMCGVMKSAVQHLPAALRQRLQSHYEKAIRAAA